MLKDQNAVLSAPLVPLHGGLESPQAEQHQSDAQEPIHTEQGGMAMQRREVESLHVVERQRRIDEEAEQSRADHVPERDRGEEHDGPAITLHPRRCAAQLEGLIGLEADEGQRHHLERGEARPERDDRRRRSREVQVMQRAEHAPGQEHDGREQHRHRRGAHAQQSQPREQEGNDRGGEHFEESFHPQVHHPPAPVLHHGDVRVLAPHEPGAVEQADANRGQRTAAR